MKYFYIVSELCKGGELFSYIEMLNNEGDFLKEKDASTVIVHVLSAMRYLHRYEVIHMDLKPENILFTS